MPFFGQHRSNVDSRNTKYLQKGKSRISLHSESRNGVNGMHQLPDFLVAVVQIFFFQSSSRKLIWHSTCSASHAFLLDIFKQARGFDDEGPPGSVNPPLPSPRLEDFEDQQVNINFEAESLRSSSASSSDSYLHCELCAGSSYSDVSDGESNSNAQVLHLLLLKYTFI